MRAIARVGIVVAILLPACTTSTGSIQKLERIHPDAQARLEHVLPFETDAEGSSRRAPGSKGLDATACEKTLRKLVSATPPRRSDTVRRGFDVLARIAVHDPIPVCRARALRILALWAGRPDADGDVPRRRPLESRAVEVADLSLDRLERDDEIVVRLEAAQNLLVLPHPEGAEGSLLLLSKRERDPMVRARVLDVLAAAIGPRVRAGEAIALRPSLVASALDAAASSHRSLSLAGIRLLEALTGRRDVPPTEAAWVRHLKQASAGSSGTTPLPRGL